MKFIFSILLIIISAILFFWVVNPLYSDVSSLRTEVATYNIALNNSKDLQMTRDKLTETYKNIRAFDKDRLERFLPNTVNNIRFILEIERIANLNSMPIKNVQFKAEKVSENNPENKNKLNTPSNTIVTVNDPNSSLPYGSFPIEFTTEGDYNTFVLFLKDLEHNLRLIDIKSINFSVPNQPEKGNITINPNIYTYNVKIETYWLK